MSYRSKFRRGVAVGSGIAVVAIAWGGVSVYRSLFARPGESALAYLPQDTAVAISIDLNPSPQQAMVFKKLDDALARNDMKDSLDRGVIEMMRDGDPAAQEIAKYTRRNGVVAALPDETGEWRGVMLIAISDAKGLDAYLRKAGKVKFFKGAQYWNIGPAEDSYAVLGDHLIVGEKPFSMWRVHRVMQGYEAPLTELKEFAAARATVPVDANIMAFLNPKHAKELDGKVALDKWGCMSASIRDGGFEITADHDFNLDSMPEFKDISHAKALSADAMDALPAGAVGAFAFAQPGIYGKGAKSMATSSPEAPEGDQGPSFDEEVRDFLGVDPDTDIANALLGNVSMAFYPSADGKSADALALIDSANGANPRLLLEKIRYHMEEMSKEEDGDFVPFTSEEYQGSTILKFNMPEEEDNGGTPHEPPMEGMPFDFDALVKDKELSMVVRGDSVLLASSVAMAKRAIDSAAGRSANMASDRSFVPSLSGSQSVWGFHFGRLAKVIRDVADESQMSESDQKSFNDAMSAMEKLTTPMSMELSVAPDGNTKIRLFIPMDYDVMVDILGDLVSSEGEG